jgi:hypothetical protein
MITLNSSGEEAEADQDKVDHNLCRLVNPCQRKRAGFCATYQGCLDTEEAGRTLVVPDHSILLEDMVPEKDMVPERGMELGAAGTALAAADTASIHDLRSLFLFPAKSQGTYNSGLEGPKRVLPNTSGGICLCALSGLHEILRFQVIGAP